MVVVYDSLVVLTNLLTTNIKLIIVLSETITVFSESIKYRVFRIDFSYHVLLQSDPCTYFSYMEETEEGAVLGYPVSAVVAQQPLDGVVT